MKFGRHRSSDHRKEVLRRYFEGGLDVPPGNKDLVFRNIRRRIAQSEGFQPETAWEEGHRRYPLSRVFHYAAAVVVLLGLGYVALRQWQIRSEEQQQLAVNEWIMKKVPNGNMVTVLLSDGTRIKLNAGSEIFYPKYFHASIRELRLSGEAWFEVAPDGQRPFIISTGNLQTRVLGTSLNIRAYPDDKSIEVALAEGKVELEYLKDGVREVVKLKPSERAVFRPKDESLARDRFNPEESIGWKDGIIYFKDADFVEITEKLSRWYGVEFYVRKEAKEMMQYTGSFQNKSLETVLQGISFASNFDFEIIGKKVIVRFN
jgi:transmembrane sensor